MDGAGEEKLALAICPPLLPLPRPEYCLPGWPCSVFPPAVGMIVLTQSTSQGGCKRQSDWECKLSSREPGMSLAREGTCWLRRGSRYGVPSACRPRPRASESRWAGWKTKSRGGSRTSPGGAWKEGPGQMLLGQAEGGCPQRLLLGSRWPSALVQPQGSAQTPQ